MQTAHTQILIGHSLELVDYSQTAETRTGVTRDLIGLPIREIVGEWLWEFVEQRLLMAAEHGTSKGVFAGRYKLTSETVAGCAVYRCFTRNPVVRFAASITYIDPRFIDLTNREMELLFLIGGNDIKQVAKEAGITLKTAYTHLRSIERKLSLENHEVRQLAVTIHNALDGDLDSLREFCSLRPDFYLPR